MIKYIAFINILRICVHQRSNAYRRRRLLECLCIKLPVDPRAWLSICGNALNENLPLASESFPVGQFPRATFSQSGVRVHIIIVIIYYAYYTQFLYKYIKCTSTQHTVI